MFNEVKQELDVFEIAFNQHENQAGEQVIYWDAYIRGFVRVNDCFYDVLLKVELGRTVKQGVADTKFYLFQTL